MYYIARDLLCYQSCLFLVARELIEVFRLDVAAGTIARSLVSSIIILYCIANLQGSNALSDKAQNPSVSLVVEPLAWGLARV